MKARVAICFLVINKMQALPEISITSAFDRTEAEILLGFLDEEDLPTLREDIEYTPVPLQALFGVKKYIESREYKDFSEDAFYQIVQYKWQLLQKVLDMGYDYVIYSDTDVYWNEDPTAELLSVFDSRKEVQVQIQSFTDNPSKPRLCMGFVAFRNSHESLDFINSCAERHKEHSKKYGRVGDDDIVTEYFINLGYPPFILELPQTTFPVGRMLKFYANYSKYPGLPSPIPFIFHANYVIGLKNKIMLIKIFIRYYSLYDKGLNLDFSSRVNLSIQHLRLFLHKAKGLLHK